MARRDDMSAAPAANDAYTGMLAISLCALIAGCVLLFLDYSQYDAKPPAVPKAPGVAVPAPGQAEAPPPKK